MRVSVILSLLATSALAAEVTIDVTNAVECTRKTQAGDAITVNYRGTLENGEEFDSSYNRAPFVFTLGKGQVIQGYVFPLLQHPTTSLGKSLLSRGTGDLTLTDNADDY